MYNKTSVNPLREPLLHFLILGLLIFLIAEWRQGGKQESGRLITVDRGLETYLGNLYHAQFGVHPDGETLTRLVDNYVREEVLFREALRLGLAQDDEIIRRRLVQKMEYLILDSEVQGRVGEAVLQDYYREHIHNYQEAATVSFQHLYFNDDQAGQAPARERAFRVLAEAPKTPDQGLAVLAGRADPFPLQDRYEQLSSPRTRQVFGQSQLTDALFEAPLGRWSGPYQSGYGWHLVFIEARNPTTALAYEEVAEKVFKDWQESVRQSQFEALMEDMLSTYVVKRETRQEQP